jgi:hypothetical protein
MLADHPIAGEAQLFVRRERSVVKEAGGNRTGGLRISLDDATPEPGDEVESAGKGRGRHALTAMTLGGIAAGDPPIWDGGCRPLVFRPALDPRQLGW